MAVRSVPTIACSVNYTLCITNDDKVFSFGFSNYYTARGAHGHNEEDVFPPKMIPTLQNIRSVACGEGHSACLSYDGNVFTFGSNEYGQLGTRIEGPTYNPFRFHGSEQLGNGDGDTPKFTHIPQKVNLPPCAQISCGENFTMCLLDNGDLYSFGFNDHGELGLGNEEETYNTPQKITTLTDVEFFDCGANHTICKTLQNEVYSWGNNYYGQLGLGNNDNQNIPILCSSLSNEDIVDIKCGSFHVLVLTANQEVFSCGSNGEGEIGRDRNDDNSTFQKIQELSEITRIECGFFFSLCIDIHNDFYVFGFNSNGQLGLGDYKKRRKPTKHVSLSNIIDMSHGGYHTFVKTSNNEIYAFGKNKYSQLGIITEKENQITPIRVFEDNDDMWHSHFNSKAKSARFTPQ